MIEKHWILLFYLYIRLFIQLGNIYPVENWVQFTQTATNCSQQQTRARQDRDQETTTNAIRNKGNWITENQSDTFSSTRIATGKKQICIYFWYNFCGLLWTSTKWINSVNNGI